MAEEATKKARRLRGAPPTNVKELGFAYEDTALGVTYVPRADGNFAVVTMTQIYNHYVGRRDRKTLEKALSNMRATFAENIGKSIATMFQGCALMAAAARPNAHHWRADGYVTLCGVNGGPYNMLWATDVTKVTCRECRTKLVNAVMAMPFLRDDDD